MLTHRRPYRQKSSLVETAASEIQSWFLSMKRLLVETAASEIQSWFLSMKDVLRLLFRLMIF